MIRFCTAHATVNPASSQHSPKVLLRSAIGAQRILDMSSGEQLPRIC